MCKVKRTKTTIVFMFPWGAIIGLAGLGASSALSAINNKKQQQAADAEAARQKVYYDAKANENPLSRSEVQHVLGQYDRAAEKQIENARSVAAITGATPEFTTAVQKGVAEGRANLMGNVAAGASQRADYYNMLGEQAQHQKALDDQRRRYERNQTYAALAANAASAVGSIMDGYSAKMPKAESPANNNQKLATGGAQIKTPGVDVGNLHVSQNGEVTNNLDWKQRTAKSIETPKLPQNPYGKDAIGFIPNADGTYTKDGMQYIKNPDGSYRLWFGK